MSASITAPRGLQTLNPSPEISRYYNKANAPYINTAQVLSEVLLPVRYPGQTFLVVDEEWWLKSGKLDVDLVLKQDSGTGITDLDYTPSPTQGTVTSSTGTDAIISLADNTNAGLMSPSDKDTLDDNVIYRSGTEVGKPVMGTIEIGNGTSLVTEEVGGVKSHLHASEGIWIIEITDGIDNLYINFDPDKGIFSDKLFDIDNDENAYIQKGHIVQLEEDVFNLELNKADLVGGLVPSSQLPAYVDDIIEGYLLSGVFYKEDTHTTAITGEIGKIYVDLTTGQKSRQYRWSGTVYIQITNGLIASTNDVPEGSNLYFTTARVLATLLSGISFLTGGAIVSTDTVLVAFGKIQKQLNDFSTALGLKQDTLTDTNFGTFTTSVGDKNTQADNDVLAYLDITTGKWVKQTFSKLVDYLKGFFVDKTTAQSIDGVKTFTASPIVPTATTSNQAVNLGQLKNLVKSISITDIIPHTGTTATTKVAELIIPANTVSDGEIWEIEYCVTRDATNATGTVGLNIYIDGLETGSNGFIRGLTFPAGSQYRSKGYRTLFFKNGNVRRFNNSGVFATDLGSNQYNSIGYFDLTVQNKLIINFTLAVSSDIANLEYVIFKKIN